MNIWYTQEKGKQKQHNSQIRHVDYKFCSEVVKFRFYLDKDQDKYDLESSFSRYLHI